MVDKPNDGTPVIDPTANVIALNEAANRRQDDLRAETNRRIDTELACVKEIANIRAQHVHDMSQMRSDHAEKEAMAESKRLDAVRAVDVLAATNTAERAAAANQILAQQTAVNAENLRMALNTTATTIAAQMDTRFATITERIAALEKSSYEGQGKSKVADPAMEMLLAEVKSLRESRSEAGGKQDMSRYLTGAALVLAGVLIAGAVLVTRLVGS
jgi:hypothetical protein